MTEPTGDKVSSAGTGMCELTNQIRLGIQEGGGLKETGAKTEGFRQRGIHSCRTGH